MIKAKRTPQFNAMLKINMLMKGYNADQFYRKFNLNKSQSDQILFRSRFIDVVSVDGLLDLIGLEIKINKYELEIVDIQQGNKS
jgi:hypothetical protein